MFEGKKRKGNTIDSTEHIPDCKKKDKLVLYGTISQHNLLPWSFEQMKPVVKGLTLYQLSSMTHSINKLFSLLCLNLSAFTRIQDMMNY